MPRRPSGETLATDIWCGLAFKPVSFQTLESNRRVDANFEEASFPGNIFVIFCDNIQAEWHDSTILMFLDSIKLCIELCSMFFQLLISCYTMLFLHVFTESMWVYSALRCLSALIYESMETLSFLLPAWQTKCRSPDWGFDETRKLCGEIAWMFELLELDISVKSKLLGEAHNHLCLAVNELWDNHPQPQAPQSLCSDKNHSRQHSQLHQASAYIGRIQTVQNCNDRHPWKLIWIIIREYFWVGIIIRTYIYIWYYLIVIAVYMM